MSESGSVRILGRYALGEVIGSGGMATVYVGRLLGPVGFSRTVAIKRMHPHLSRDPEFVTMFLEEARLASRIQHANVVATLDVVTEGRELFHVMDYIDGETLAALTRSFGKRGARVPLPILGSIISQTLHGLQAVHDATDDDGRAMGLVHRDVSPDNVLIGRDGLSRITDFGVAKATERGRQTSPGTIKGKVCYMSPEHVRAQPLDRRADVYSASVVLWEALTGRRLFSGKTEVEQLQSVLGFEIPTPSDIVPEISKEVDALVMKGLQGNPADRYATAREMAIAVENALGVASPASVAALIETFLGPELSRRATVVELAIRNIAESVRAVPQGVAHTKRFDEPMIEASFSASHAAKPDPDQSETVPAFRADLELELELEPSQGQWGKPSAPPSLEVPATRMDVETKADTRSVEEPAPAGRSVSGPPRSGFELVGAQGPSMAVRRPPEARGPDPFRARQEAPPPARGVPLWLYGALGVVVLAGAAFGAKKLFTSQGKAGAPAKSSGAAVSSTDACETFRKRLKQGGDTTGLSREGLVAELWLRGPSGAAIDPSVSHRELLGSDADSTSVVTTLVSARGETEGMLIEIHGAAARSVVDPTGQAAMAKAADDLYEKVGAEAGALTLRCEHLPHHDFGFWFRGRDEYAAVSALLFSMGTFTDFPIVREEVLDPKSLKGETVYERVYDLVSRTGRKGLPLEVRIAGGTVDPVGDSTRIVFLNGELSEPIRGTRAVAHALGIEAH